MNGQYLTLGVGDLFAAADSFLRQYGSDSVMLNVWFQIVLDVCDIIDQVGEQVALAAIIGQTPLYRTIPFQAIQAKSGLYWDASVAAANPGWADMATADKVAILDGLGLYEALDVRRPMDGESDNGKHRIISAVLDRQVGTSLPYVPSVDYVISNNRLYLFGVLAAPAGSGQSKTLYLKNIKIDLNTLEAKWGTLLGYDQPAEFTPIVYRAALVWLLQIYFTGPTVAGLQSFSQQMGPAWQSFQVIDQVNAPADMGWLWSTGLLTPFQFVLRVPAEQSALVLGSNFDSLVRRIKPAPTDFKLMWTTQPVVESVPLSDSLQTIYVTDPEIPRNFAGSIGPLPDQGVRADAGIEADQFTTVLNWRSNTDTTTSFELWRGENGGALSLLATITNGPGYLTYTDVTTGLQAGTELDYEVRAVAPSRDSAFSPIVRLVT